MVAIQVICIDYSMQKINDIVLTNRNSSNNNTNSYYPNANPSNLSIPRPVIRIFGSSSKSLRSYCVNIHDIYPYLYFRPESIYDNSFDDFDTVESYLPYIHKMLEDLSQKYRQQLEAERNGSNSMMTDPSMRNPNRIHNDSQKSMNTNFNNNTIPLHAPVYKKSWPIVYKLEVVMKKSIYGYYPNDVPFVKVYLYNPAHIKLMVSVLESGHIGGVVMQPYESHIPFLLQFTTDFNIPPMGWLHVEEAMVRRNNTDYMEQEVSVPATSNNMRNELNRVAEKESVSVDKLHCSSAEYPGILNNISDKKRSDSVHSHPGLGSGLVQEELLSVLEEVECFTNSKYLDGDKTHVATGILSPSNGLDASVVVDNDEDVNSIVKKHSELVDAQVQSKTGLEAGQCPVVVVDMADEVGLGDVSVGGEDSVDADICKDLFCATPVDSPSQTTLANASQSSIESYASTVGDVNLDNSIDETPDKRTEETVCGVLDPEEAQKRFIEELLEGITLSQLIGSQPQAADSGIMSANAYFDAKKGSGTVLGQDGLVNKGDVRSSGTSADCVLKIPTFNGNCIDADVLDPSVTKKANPIGAANSALWKRSACAVEIDVHCSSILNKNHPDTEFGAELWKKSEFQSILKDSSNEKSTACHDFVKENSYCMVLPGALKSLVETDFTDRLQNLLRKGEALANLQEMEEEEEEEEEEEGSDTSFREQEPAAWSRVHNANTDGYQIPNGCVVDCRDSTSDVPAESVTNCTEEYVVMSDEDPDSHLKISGGEDNSELSSVHNYVTSVTPHASHSSSFSYNLSNKEGSVVNAGKPFAIGQSLSSGKSGSSKRSARMSMMLTSPAGSVMTKQQIRAARRRHRQIKAINPEPDASSILHTDTPVGHVSGDHDVEEVRNGLSAKSKFQRNFSLLSQFQYSQRTPGGNVKSNCIENVSQKGGCVLTKNTLRKQKKLNPSMLSFTQNLLSYCNSDSQGNTDLLSQFKAESQFQSQSLSASGWYVTLNPKEGSPGKYLSQSNIESSCVEPANMDMSAYGPDEDDDEYNAEYSAQEESQGILAYSTQDGHLADGGEHCFEPNIPNGAGVTHTKSRALAVDNIKMGGVGVTSMPLTTLGDDDAVKQDFDATSLNTVKNLTLSYPSHSQIDSDAKSQASSHIRGGVLNSSGVSEVDVFKKNNQNSVLDSKLMTAQVSPILKNVDSRPLVATAVNAPSRKRKIPINASIGVSTKKHRYSVSFNLYDETVRSLVNDTANVNSADGPLLWQTDAPADKSVKQSTTHSNAGINAVTSKKETFAIATKITASGDNRSQLSKMSEFADEMDQLGGCRSKNEEKRMELELKSIPMEKKGLQSFKVKRELFSNGSVEILNSSSGCVVGLRTNVDAFQLQLEPSFRPPSPKNFHTMTTESDLALCGDIRLPYSPFETTTCVNQYMSMDESTKPTTSAPHGIGAGRHAVGKHVLGDMDSQDDDECDAHADAEPSLQMGDATINTLCTSTSESHQSALHGCVYYSDLKDVTRVSGNTSVLFNNEFASITELDNKKFTIYHKNSNLPRFVSVSHNTPGAPPCKLQSLIEEALTLNLTDTGKVNQSGIKPDRLLDTYADMRMQLVSKEAWGMINGPKHSRGASGVDVCSLTPSFAPPNPKKIYQKYCKSKAATKDLVEGGASFKSARQNGSVRGVTTLKYSNQLLSNVITSPTRTGQCGATCNSLESGALNTKEGTVAQTKRKSNDNKNKNKTKNLDLKVKVDADGGGVSKKLDVELLQKKYDGMDCTIGSVSAVSGASRSDSDRSRSDYNKETISELTQNKSMSLSDNSNPTKPLSQAAQKAQNISNYSRKVIMSIEVFCKSRCINTTNASTNNKTALTPDPKYDPIDVLFYIVEDIVVDELKATETSKKLYGMIEVQPFEASSRPGEMDSNLNSAPNCKEGQTTPSNKHVKKDAKRFVIHPCSIPTATRHDMVGSESDLLVRFIEIVHKQDPDFIIGYEIQKFSLGYVIARSNLLFPEPKMEPGGELLTGTHLKTTHLAHHLTITSLISRMPSEKESYMNEIDRYGEEHASGIHIAGRIVLNLWRCMKEELKLYSYSVHNVASQLLEMRLPEFSYSQLTRWYDNKRFKHRVYFYLYKMTEVNGLLLDKLDLVRRTGESARLYGIDFFSVLSRGSQYRVEAVLLKKAHNRGYLCLAPSKVKVARQAAMSVIPLVMEPQSAYYPDPVVVLDFTSLYPSMIIAYNLCYTTILGKLRIGACDSNDSDPDILQSGLLDPNYVAQDTTGRLGTEKYPEAYTALGCFYNTLNQEHSPTASSSRYNANSTASSKPFLAPNGSLFCNKKTRLGLLPQMLNEILSARVLVKKAMKYYKKLGDKSGASSLGIANDILGRVLDAQQLAIKLLANVTYGYTAAGFSGRMPMAELADAVVQCGRTTLEWTNQVIREGLEGEKLKSFNDSMAQKQEFESGVESSAQRPLKGWKNARVVYGDTDSVFVHLPGRTKEEAFRIGSEIATYISQNSPGDVTLKLEKVYMGAVMVTKKRYVGNSYETVDQKVPHFDAKGLECIRRDQCLATAKIQEKALRLLFESRGDLSLVKDCLCKEWYKIEAGLNQVSLQDFVFHRAVKLGHYSSPSSYPPGATVALKQMITDPHSYPVYKWRVPYVVVYGTSQKSSLKDLVVSPQEVLRRNNTVLILNTRYYINKCINPALARVFNLCGADIVSWYRNMSPHAVVKQRRVVYYDSTMLNHGGGDGKAIRNENTGNLLLRIDDNGMVSDSTAGIHSNNLIQTSILKFSTKASCDICGEYAASSICTRCKEVGVSDMGPNTKLVVSSLSYLSLVTRLNSLKTADTHLKRICQQCVGGVSASGASQTIDLYKRNELLGSDCCVSMDCPVFFKRYAYMTRIEDNQYALNALLHSK